MLFANTKFRRLIQPANVVKPGDLERFILAVKTPTEEDWCFLAQRKVWRNGAPSNELGSSFDLLSMEDARRLADSAPKDYRWSIRRPTICDDAVLLVEVLRGRGLAAIGQVKVPRPAVPLIPELPEDSDGECFSFKDPTSFDRAAKACKQAMRRGVPRSDSLNWLNAWCPTCRCRGGNPCLLERGAQRMMRTNPHPQRVLQAFLEGLPALEREAAKCELIRRRFVTAECPDPEPSTLSLATREALAKGEDGLGEMPGFSVEGTFQDEDDPALKSGRSKRPIRRSDLRIKGFRAFSGPAAALVPLAWPTADFELALEKLDEWCGRRGERIEGLGVLRSVALVIRDLEVGEGKLDKATETKLRRILAAGRFPEMECTEDSIDFR